MWGQIIGAAKGMMGGGGGGGQGERQLKNDIPTMTKGDTNAKRAQQAPVDDKGSKGGVSLGGNY